LARTVDSANGQPALRVSGIFKLVPVIGDGSATDPLGLR
jgi:hypothetical protein